MLILTKLIPYILQLFQLAKIDPQYSGPVVLRDDILETPLIT